MEDSILKKKTIKKFLWRRRKIWKSFPPDCGKIKSSIDNTAQNFKTTSESLKKKKCQLFLEHHKSYLQLWLLGDFMETLFFHFKVNFNERWLCFTVRCSQVYLQPWKPCQLKLFSYGGKPLILLCSFSNNFFSLASRNLSFLPEIFSEGKSKLRDDQK